MKQTIRIILLAALALIAGAAQADTKALCQSVTATGTQTAVASPAATKTYQANGTTASGSGSAVVAIEGSLRGDVWDSIGTITLTLGTAATSGSFTSVDRYAQVRCNVTTLTGTGASLTSTMGY